MLRYLESVPLILVAGVPKPSALSAMFYVFATQDSAHAPFNQNKDSPIETEVEGSAYLAFRKLLSIS